MKAMPPFSPGKILCPVDMSELSDLALKYAHVGAHLFDATLTVLHAMHIEYPRYLSRDLIDRMIEEMDGAKSAARQELKEHVHRVLGQAETKVRIDYQVTDSEPSDVIMQILDENKADLVVMGTHGYSGFKHWMLGSVTESVLHRSKVPVFTIRRKINDFIDSTQPDERPNIRHILCPCNLTGAAGRALQVASALADRFKASLTALCSLESDKVTDETEFLAWIHKTVGTAQGIDPLVRRGEAAAQAISMARELNCDLIVIGARHQAFEHGTVVGRTTELVLRHASVPVLAVPSHDEVL